MVKNLIKIFDEFKEKKILVIGDVMLDQFLFGDSKRINPDRPGAPLLKVEMEKYILGGAGNVANNIVSLGGSCDLWSVFGNDPSGEKIKELCKESKINLENFYDKNPTIVKLRGIGDMGHYLCRFDFGEANLKKINQEVENKILSSFSENSDKYDFVIFSDYDKTIFTKGLVYNLINKSNSKGINSLADPKPKNIDFFKDCAIICPNEKEAEEMTQIRYSNGKEILTKMGEALSERINSKYVVITCGKDGAFFYDKKNSSYESIPTRAKAVMDVTGAGDTFAAALALSMACKANIRDCVEIANYAAGVVVGKVGTATVTTDEIKEFLENRKV